MYPVCTVKIITIIRDHFLVENGRGLSMKRHHLSHLRQSTLLFVSKTDFLRRGNDHSKLSVTQYKGSSNVDLIEHKACVTMMWLLGIKLAISHVGKRK